MSHVVVLLSTRPGTLPAVFGPWTDKVEATAARVRLRNKFDSEEAPFSVTSTVRTLQKEEA